MNTQDYQELSKTNDLYFWYKARTELIDHLLSKNFPGHLPDRQILDIGCGTGTELDILKKYGQITALDMDTAALDIIKKENCRTIQGDIEKMDLPSEHFDCICCFDIIEHIKEDKAVLRKIYSSLKTGGILLYTVPAWQFLYSTHDKHTGHVRRYSKNEITNKLKKSHFKDIRANYWNFFLFIPIAAVRICKKILISNSKTEKEYATDAKPLIKPANSFLFQILHLENILIKAKLKFPFGLTVFGSGKK